MYLTFQDNNGVIGLLEPMKTCLVPVKIPLTEPVMKIASGMTQLLALFTHSLKYILCLCLTFVDIFLGNDHVALLTLDGNLYTLGCAEQGQLGRVPEQFSNRGGRKGLGRYHITLHIPLLSNDFNEFYLLCVLFIFCFLFQSDC